MIELYHGLASTCSKKVRLCLEEKGLEWQSHLLQLQKFEQFDPEYLKLNPNGVVPTLAHDGRVVTESTIIIEYLDDAFPDPPLKPSNPFARAQMRLWKKWSDDVGYAAVYIPTWDRVSRPVVEKFGDEELEELLDRVPTAERRARWRQVARGGFSRGEFDGAYEKMERSFARMETTLADGPWLAGAAFSLGDIAMTPFIDRMLDLRADLVGPERFPAVHDWVGRLAERPSFRAAFFFQNMDASTGAVSRALAGGGA